MYKFAPSKESILKEPLLQYDATPKCSMLFYLSVASVLGTRCNVPSRSQDVPSTQATLKGCFLSHPYVLSNLAWNGKFRFVSGASFVFKKNIHFFILLAKKQNKTIIVITLGTNNENPKKD